MSVAKHINKFMTIIVLYYSQFTVWSSSYYFTMSFIFTKFKLVHIIICLSACSVPSESLFSIARHFIPGSEVWQFSPKSDEENRKRDIFRLP